MEAVRSSETWVSYSGANTTWCHDPEDLVLQGYVQFKKKKTLINHRKGNTAISACILHLKSLTYMFITQDNYVYWLHKTCTLHQHY